MALVAILNDTHWGARNDSKAFADYFHRFYAEIFFPYLVENDIKTIFHLGDVFDRRKYINFVTAANFENHFIKPCSDNDIELVMIAGNHDTFYKNTNEVNSIRRLYKNTSYSNVTVHWQDPVELNVDGCKIVLSPWICADNEESTMEFFEKTSAQIVMGHFEISGYEMMRGQICDHGLDRNIFKKFDAVYSGHFHHPSSHGNISYLGAQYEMTWSDYDQVRGFSVFNTDTREMTYVKNPLKMFHKIFYDDTNMTMEDVAGLDVSELSNTYIKVIVQNKTNPYIFDMYLDKIQEMSPADIKVVEDHKNLDVIDEEQLVDEAQDTLTILKRYIENVEVNGKKDEIEKFLGELYHEAISIE